MADPVWVKSLLPGPSVTIDARSRYVDDDILVPPDRPYVIVNMVASVDGATAIDGVTKALGSPADRAIFLHLRDLADAILVGAATVRAEGYGPARPSSHARGRRRSRGQALQPPIVVMSRSMVFDWATPFFTEAISRPILIVPSDISERRVDPARAVAEIIQTGTGSVDVMEGLRQLKHRGIRVLLCEGGPALNAELLRAGVIDELCLTISPLLVGGVDPKGIFGEVSPVNAVSLSLVHVLEAEGNLFLRYQLRHP